MHNHCNYNILTYNYSQLQLDGSVTGRQYHSMSALHIGPRCVWLLVFGGYPNIADTIIIELSEYRAILMSCIKAKFSVPIVFSNCIFNAAKSWYNSWRIARVIKKGAICKRTIAQRAKRDRRDDIHTLQRHQVSETICS